jgi:hypothetical protein
VVWVGDGQLQRITENSHGFREADAMLFYVGMRLVRIPFELHCGLDRFQHLFVDLSIDLAKPKGTSRTIVRLVASWLSGAVIMAIVRRLQQKYGAVPVIWRTQAVTIRLTAIANVVMAKAAGHFAASRASSTTFLIPVVALAGGAICVLGAYQMKRSQ